MSATTFGNFNSNKGQLLFGAPSLNTKSEVVPATVPKSFLFGAPNVVPKPFTFNTSNDSAKIEKNLFGVPNVTPKHFSFGGSNDSAKFGQNLLPVFGSSQIPKLTLHSLPAPTSGIDLFNSQKLKQNVNNSSKPATRTNKRKVSMRNKLFKKNIKKLVKKSFKKLVKKYNLKKQTSSDKSTI